MSTLLVTVDAVRADHLGQYGYDRNTMPAVDRLLDAGGTRFAAAYANAPYTGLSLPSFLTSRYLGDEQVRAGPTVATALPDDAVTGAIHSNTFFASKFDGVAGMDVYEDFYGESEHGEDVSLGNRVARGVFDTVRPAVKRLGLFEVARRVQERVLPARFIHEVAIYESATVTTDRAIEFLDRLDRGADGRDDFFLWVHYMEPHRPYGINLDDPAYCDPIERRESFDLMATAGVHPERVTPDQRERLRDLYDSDIRYASEEVDRLFDALRERGRWRDTDVLLTADHGEEFGEHGRYFHRNRPYDELLHVPLVVKSDRADGGVVDDQRTLLDLAPTVCAGHGVDPPDSFLGTDLFVGEPRRAIATGSFRDDGQVVTARWDGWKCIFIEGGTDELYDVDRDPGETENVAADHPAVLRTYREGVPAHLFEATGEGAPDREDVSEDVERRLEGLGYLE